MKETVYTRYQQLGSSNFIIIKLAYLPVTTYVEAKTKLIRNVLVNGYQEVHIGFAVANTFFAIASEPETLCTKCTLAFSQFTIKICTATELYVQPVCYVVFSK